MNLNRHSPALVAGKHAILSPSNNAWVNYTEDKLARVYHAQQAAVRGTRLHELAQNLIIMGVKLPDTPTTLNMYVNEAIGYRMTPEQILYYSENCFGTADACGFKDDTLRIHDLKTGINEASFVQLEIYDALFCLEYGMHPRDIQIENRIYQNDSVKIQTPDPADVVHLMETIRFFDKRLKYLKEEAE